LRRRIYARLLVGGLRARFTQSAFSTSVKEAALRANQRRSAPPRLKAVVCVRLTLSAARQKKKKTMAVERCCAPCSYILTPPYSNTSNSDADDFFNLHGRRALPRNLAKGKRLRPDRMRPLGAHRAPDQFTIAPFGSLLQAETSWSRSVDPVAWHVPTYRQHDYFRLANMAGARCGELQLHGACSPVCTIFLRLFSEAYRHGSRRMLFEASS